jgi:acylphosphatase
MSEEVSARVIVSGVVQRVGFRYFTLCLAHEYGLTGWIRNTPQGNVEIEVEGDQGLITQFSNEIRIGPRSARVTSIDVQWGTYTGEYNDFRVRF